ncbi:phage-associated protein, BcepMu gp16 family [Aromatoleum tolulyticum]|uniref:Phage-associated protein, BcepMu gp16 family n=1 Tax=Aromatoleum tolulyticum TaxID=34027 RepID=A0A1N6WYV2_9RHOO|nr:DNA-binding protein [Aromatoleum tolulyticum]SIQ95247.1 phage-associated protein, BcepMu gp16 family [Aromatoleum tolulyticum]
MAAAVPKGKRVRSLKEAREAFHRSGKTVVAWAKENGFTPALVYMVLSGQRRGLRGQSHRIAVKLGIKNGVIDEAPVFSHEEKDDGTE